MKKSELTPSKTGLPVHLTSWLPDNGEFSAVMLLVHGFGEWGGRYDLWAERFCKNDIAVYAPDLRGHGKTVGKRGVVSDYREFLEDLERVVSWLPKEMPKILYGHSMGGNISLNYLLNFDHTDFKAAIITSPWLRLKRQPPETAIKLVRQIGRMLPSFTIVSRIHNDVLAHDIEYVKETKKEGLYHNNIGARTFCGIYDAGKYAIENAGAIAIPTLFLQAGDDKLVDIEAAWEFERNKSDLVDFRVLEGQFHEIHNDDQRNEVFETMRSFLQKNGIIQATED